MTERRRQDRLRHDELMTKFVKEPHLIKESRKDYRELLKLNKYLLKVKR